MKSVSHIREWLEVFAIQLGLSSSFTTVFVFVSGSIPAVAAFKKDRTHDLGMCFDQLEDVERAGERVIRFAMKVPNGGRETLPLIIAARRHGVDLRFSELPVRPVRD